MRKIIIEGIISDPILRQADNKFCFRICNWGTPLKFVEIFKSLLFINHFESYLTIDESSYAADWYSREESQNGVRPINIVQHNGGSIVLHNNGDGKSTDEIIAISKSIKFVGSGPTDDIYSTVSKGF